MDLTALKSALIPTLAPLPPPVVEPEKIAHTGEAPSDMHMLESAWAAFVDCIRCYA